MRLSRRWLTALLVMASGTILLPALAVAEIPPGTATNRVELTDAPAAPKYNTPVVAGSRLSGSRSFELDLSDSWFAGQTAPEDFVEEESSSALSSESPSAEDLGVTVTMDGADAGDVASVGIRRLASDDAVAMSPFGNAVELSFTDTNATGSYGPARYTVGFSIDSAEFQGGADVLGRLQLVRYDGCSAQGDETIRCALVQPLASTVDTTSGVVSAVVDDAALTVQAMETADAVAAVDQEMSGFADVSLGGFAEQMATMSGLQDAAPSGPPSSFVALATAAAAGTGDFSATPIESLSVYEVAAYTGSAEATYTVPTPEAAAGPTPSVSFTYSSSSIDGMNSASNNQAGPVGLGWSLMAGGSVTREFGACNPLADGPRPPVDRCPTAAWDDLAEERFTITLNGVSSKLVHLSGNEFRLLNDPMWQVFRHTDRATHPHDGGESWEVRTPDGTRWLLGMDDNSSRNVPVYFQAEFGDRPPGCTDVNRICDMVYQWDLDQVIDTLGNTSEYDYLKETNFYNARGLGSREYVRASSLREIRYGSNANAGDTKQAGEANARVVFNWELRCADSRSAATCGPTAEEFPDTPVDKWCQSVSTPCASNLSPTFFSFLRLGSVATQIRQDDSSWRTRDVHDLVQYFPEVPDDIDGDENPPKLALAQIRQRPNETEASDLYRHYGFSPIRAVDFDESSGSIFTSGVSGALGFDAAVSELSSHDELRFRQVWLGGAKGDGAASEVALHYANGTSETGSVEVVVHDRSVATIELPPTGGDDKFTTKVAAVVGLEGTASVTLRFTGPDTDFARLAWMQFNAISFDQIPSLPPVDYGGPDNWVFKQNRVNGDDNLVNRPSMKMPRIKTIENELGARVTFTYSDPTCEIPDPAEPQWNINDKWCYPAFESETGDTIAWYKYTVAEMLVEPGSGQPPIRTEYDYFEPRWAFSNPSNDCDTGPTWNDFRGHNRVRITDPSGISEYRYFQGMGKDQSPCTDPPLPTLDGPVIDSRGNSFDDDRWLQGQSYEMLRLDPGGDELERETTEYDTSTDGFDSGDERGVFTTAGTGPDAARFVAPARTTSTILIGEDKTNASELFYDVHGNVIKENQTGDTETPDDDRVATIDYVKNTDVWIVQSPCRDRLAPANDLDNPVSETRWGYDTDRSADPDTACSSAPIQGLQTNAWSYYSSDQANQISTEFNDRGQPIATTDGRGNTDRMRPDPLHGWLLSETNPRSWETSYHYDHLGHQTAIDDVNGNVTRLAYDDYDRLVNVWLPDVEAEPSYVFEYGIEQRPVEVVTKTLFDDTREGDEQYLIVAEYIDGLGRDIQRQSRAQNPEARWVTSMGYDNAGRLHRESTAYEIPGESGDGAVVPAGDWSTVPLHHVYSYDGRDEMIRDRTLGNAEGQETTDWSSTYIFDGWTTQVTDEDGFRTDHEHDAFANVTKIVEYDEVEAIYSTTVHAYDVADRLVSTTDDEGNVVEIGYDRLGRRTIFDDPNAGKWLFNYDANDNLALQRDGRGVWIGFSYDNIDRVEQRHLSNEAGATNDLLAAYEYDGDIGNDRLRAKTAYTPEGEVVVANAAFDSQGQILEQVTTVPGSTGGTFRQRFEWGAGGQQKVLHYPKNNGGETGEQVTTGFDWRTGLPVALSSDLRGEIVHDTQYGADGQERSRSYGTGGADLRETWDIDVRTERTTTYRAGNSAELSNVINFGYTYNNRGDTASISDGVNHGQNQCFGYDARSRLTKAYTGNDGCTAPDPSRGKDPYDEAYSYDTIHNLTSNAVEGTLVYGESEAAGPHAVTSTASGDTYTYDYNGNQTGRSVDDEHLTIRYNAQNEIDRIEKGAGDDAVGLESYLYDADHERVQRTQEGNTVVYVGQTYEWTAIGDNIKPREPGPDPHVPRGPPDPGKPDGITVELGSKRLIGTHGSDNVTEPVSIDLPDGSYTIHLHSADELHGDGAPSQPNEQWVLEALDSNGDVVFATTPTNDLPDSETSEPTNVGSYPATGVVSVRARHAAISDSPNSIVPVRATFVADSGTPDPGTPLALDAEIWAYSQIPDPPSALAAEGMTAHYYLASRRVAVLESGDLSYTLHDHLNSAAATVASDGTFEIARYRPWGQERTNPLAGSFGYGGQRKSDRTGLLDFDTRFYDPGIGRFISPDTSVPDFNNPAALNRYSYVSNNPMTYFDPHGEFGISSIKNAVKKTVKTTVAVTKTVATAASKIDPHTALDIAGMLPDPVGTVADAANTLYYLAEGDYKNAAISALAMLPAVGTGAAALRHACKVGCDKAVKGASEVAERAGKQTARQVDKIP